jgi:hypothetical protein
MEIERPGGGPGVTLCERHGIQASLALRLERISGDRIPVKVSALRFKSISGRYTVSLAASRGIRGYLNADSGEGVVEGSLLITDSVTKCKRATKVRAGMFLNAATGLLEIESKAVSISIPASPAPLTIRFLITALCGCFGRRNCQTMIFAKRAVSCIGGDDCVAPTTCRLHSRPKGQPGGRWTPESGSKDVPYDPTLDYLCFCS